MMPLTAQAIASNSDLLAYLKIQAKSQVDLDSQYVQMATAFRTQQRWKLGQLAMALHFKGRDKPGVEGLNAAGYLQQVERLGIASRNTADTFLKQMLAFNALRVIEARDDRRKRFLEPTSSSLVTFDKWLSVHLATLDRLSDAGRVERYAADREAIAVVQPVLAEFFLKPAQSCEPEGRITPFLWSNNGFIVTEHLVMALENAAPAGERLFTSVTAISDLAAALNMSRSNASQRLREAEAIGAIGWEGARGQSRLWLSRGLVDAYLGYQAGFLAQIDLAYCSYFEPRSVDGIASER